MDKQALFMYAFIVSTFKLYLVNAINIHYGDLQFKKHNKIMCEVVKSFKKNKCIHKSAFRK